MYVYIYMAVPWVVSGLGNLVAVARAVFLSDSHWSFDSLVVMSPRDPGTTFVCRKGCVPCDVEAESLTETEQNIFNCKFNCMFKDFQRVVQVCFLWDVRSLRMCFFPHGTLDTFSEVQDHMM